MSFYVLIWQTTISSYSMLLLENVWLRYYIKLPPWFEIKPFVLFLLTTTNHLVLFAYGIKTYINRRNFMCMTQYNEWSHVDNVICWWHHSIYLASTLTGKRKSPGKYQRRGWQPLRYTYNPMADLEALTYSNLLSLKPLLPIIKKQHSIGYGVSMWG